MLSRRFRRFKNLNLTKIKRKHSSVTFIVPNKISYTTLSDLISSMLEHSLYVFIICPPDMNKFLKESLVETNPYTKCDSRIYFQDILQLSRESYLRDFIFRLLLNILTPKNFSQHYAYLSETCSLSAKRYKNRIKKLISGRIPLLTVPRVNQVVQACCNVFLKNSFKSKVVITTTPGTLNHLLLSNFVYSVFIQESWDHCAKHPLGFIPDIIHCWNSDLANDWMLYQGINSAKSSYPFKLKWAIDSEHNWKNPTSSVIMYSASFSGQSYINSLFKLELKLISWILDVLKVNMPSFKLYIKPKPNGIKGDFDHLLDSHDNIIIGKYSNASSSVDYVLDDNYNKSRIEELNKVEAVICLATTFALDAALTGAPVIMIDPRFCSDLGELSQFCNNFHLRKYLYSRTSAYRLEDKLNNSTQSFCERLSRPYVKASLFSAQTRAWLKPVYTYKEILENIVDNAIRHC